ncbi:synaptonemal complex protein 3-like isoform X1 [Sminthopsis crassicaudata]|uniref:synaptonemal complex protein 3-like isoform X1 n=1 Tax=Sminthopsis crassicaudata TaxID=9301 RepID=UPI003D697EB6
MEPEGRAGGTCGELAAKARERPADDFDKEGGKGPRDSRADAEEGGTAAGEKPGVKRSATVTAAAALKEGLRREIQSMLETFGGQFNEVLLAKKKRLEMHTEPFLKRNTQKIEDIWKTHKEQRQKLNQEYSQQFLTLFQQWHLDVKKTKEEEAKLANIIQQQLKMFQKGRKIQSQRLNTIKQQYEQFLKDMEDLEKNHESFLIGAQDELQE